jgi:hypothetical protein
MVKLKSRLITNLVVVYQFSAGNDPGSIELPSMAISTLWPRIIMTGYLQMVEPYT